MSDKHVIKRVVVEFVDGTASAFKVNPGDYSLDIKRDIIRAGDEGVGFKRFEAVASGRVKFEAGFDSLTVAVAEPRRGSMIELRGILDGFRDETQIADVTPYGARDRVAIPGVMGWSVTLRSSGPQSMTPGELLTWMQENRVVRILAEGIERR